MPDTRAIQPIVVQGTNTSSFTGKLENYFRLKGIPYALEAMTFPAAIKLNAARVGISQMPVVGLGDGRWMTDTTAMIQWFEQHYPEPRVIPDDPLLRFFSLLLEDYADEWLWRPAMHYRWYYDEGAHLQSRHLVDELVRGVPVPKFLMRYRMRQRQRSGYTAGDGIVPEAVAGVEAIFLRTLEQLKAIFEHRPFLLGDRPSLADVGFSGPFFRHFALDPVALEVIRQNAPGVLEWVARLWGSRLENCQGSLFSGIPDDLGPILDEIGRAYLPYLCANVDAVAEDRKRFDADIDGVPYRGARYSRYRVWCLSELRREFEALPDDAAGQARQLLEKHGCWEPLWRQAELPLLPGQEEGLPFQASAKMVGANE